MKDNKNNKIFACVKVIIFAIFYFAIIKLGYSQEEYSVLSPHTISELDEKIKQHLHVHDFEEVLEMLPDQLFLDLNKTIQDYVPKALVADTATKDDHERIYKQLKDFYSAAVNNFIFVKIHCLIMLERRSESSDFIAKLISEDVEGYLFFAKGLVDCINDNYGNATISFTKAIELNQSVEMTFGCYMQRACIYAMRKMHKEAENDLLMMQNLRQQFPTMLPPIQSPAEFMIGKYLADPKGKVIYRVGAQGRDPSKPSLYVFWWCSNLSEDTIDEFVRLYSEYPIPKDLYPTDYIPK